jgi:hypothetical protein
MLKKTRPGPGRSLIDIQQAEYSLREVISERCLFAFKVNLPSPWRSKPRNTKSMVGNFRPEEVLLRQIHLQRISA